MIVDYGHDETAIRHVVFFASLLTKSITSPVTGQMLRLLNSIHSQPSEQPDPSQTDILVNEDETATVSEKVHRDIDALKKLLPPPPNTKCYEELLKRLVD
ncbi:hypothetical protein MKW94_027682 [Papaver nudicaule]|uniref:Uncharacterized protein n=1 Tax=Papaver nudicaule TaxID=74823 RepID=A0AA41V783_PAPNU|nr:hypothetical protein [Papaver nudicaule]